MFISVSNSLLMNLTKQDQPKNAKVGGKSETRSTIKRKTYTLKQLTELKYEDKSSGDDPEPNDSSLLVGKQVFNRFV